MVSETKTSINNHPGRILKIEVPKPAMVAQVKIFLVKNRLYQVVAVSAKGHKKPKTVKKFLDSFKLKK